MAITRYAGDRFIIAPTDTKPTGVMPGAFLIDSGNKTSGSTCRRRRRRR